MTDILPPAGWPNVRQLETNEFALGGANGNMNEQAKSLAARSELLKQYAALPYESKTGGYALNERVQLATGDIVRSTIASNVNNPNVNMTGWEVSSLKPEKNLSDVPNKAAARSNLSVYSQAQVDNAIANATPTIPNATTTDKGIVQLNNTLTSTSSTQALTAAQGKVLADSKIETTARGAANGVASLGADTRVPVSQLPAATISDAGVLRFATATEVANKSNVMAAVTPADVAAMIGQPPNATPTIPNATETVAGIAKIAPLTDTFIATDDTQFVTPKKLLAGVKYHLNANGTAPVYACRAWVNFDGTGTPTIKASGNVSSITDNGVGDYTLNFAKPMPNANYSISLGGAEASDGAPLILSLRMSGEAPLLKSTSAVRVSIKSPNSGVAYDTNNISVQVFC